MLRRVLKSVCEMPQTRSQTFDIVRTLSQTPEYKLQHDEAKKRLCLQLDESKRIWLNKFHDFNLLFFSVFVCSEEQAFVDYKRISKDEVLLYHTSVPSIYGGKGIGNILAKETFKFFDDRKEKMSITCPFLVKIRAQPKKWTVI